MNSTPETRYTLIGKLHNPQDAEAWAEFTSIYQPLIFRICRRRGLQHADAVDVTQDVLAKVAQAIEKFDMDQHGATFRGWLYRVTQNLVIDFMRKRDRNVLAKADHSLIKADQEQGKGSEESIEFRLEYQRQIFWLAAKEVRSQVKPTTWLAFHMTEIERRPVEEVAKELKLTTGSVYVSRSRVIAKLKNQAELRLSETNQ